MPVKAHLAKDEVQLGLGSWLFQMLACLCGKDSNPNSREQDLGDATPPTNLLRLLIARTLGHFTELLSPSLAPIGWKFTRRGAHLLRPRTCPKLFSIIINSPIDWNGEEALDMLNNCTL